MYRTSLDKKSFPQKKEIYYASNELTLPAGLLLSNFYLYLITSKIIYSAGEEKSPLFIFLHDQLPLFLGETGRNSGEFLQVSPGNPIFSPGNTCISP